MIIPHGKSSQQEFSRYPPSEIPNVLVHLVCMKVGSVVGISTAGNWTDSAVGRKIHSANWRLPLNDYLPSDMPDYMAKPIGLPLSWERAGNKESSEQAGWDMG